MRAAVCAGALLVAVAAWGRDVDDPIRLGWTEGDVAGLTPIEAPDRDRPIGYVEFHQRRHGGVLEARRIARFADGSSDEDVATAEVGDGTLVARSGRTLIRAPGDRVIVDLQIDVPSGHIAGFYVDDGKRRDVDDRKDLGPGTYWGPLIFLVVKNFAANAEDGRVRFRTVVPTPRPRVLTMELVRDGSRSIERPGGRLATERYVLRPTFGWLIDPFIASHIPSTEFLVEPGTPPAFARYAGPRNFAGQEIRLE